jgi:hypothetical protein
MNPDKSGELSRIDWFDEGGIEPASERRVERVEDVP